MDSPSSRKTPTFKNITQRHKQSPVELKEKIKKNYKEKVQKCRDILLNRYRGTEDSDVKNLLSEIYKNLFNFSEEFMYYEEEGDLMEKIKNELIQEEFNWCLEEYEKSHLDNYDWSEVEREHVICPVCQKTNFAKQNKTIVCTHCNIEIDTEKSLSDIKKHILGSIEKHNSSCTSNIQFTIVPDVDEKHIYLVCDICMEMHLIL